MKPSTFVIGPTSHARRHEFYNYFEVPAVKPTWPVGIQVIQRNQPLPPLPATPPPTVPALPTLPALPVEPALPALPEWPAPGPRGQAMHEMGAYQSTDDFADVLAGRGTDWRRSFAAMALRADDNVVNDVVCRTVFTVPLNRCTSVKYSFITPKHV